MTCPRHVRDMSIGELMDQPRQVRIQAFQAAQKKKEDQAKELLKKKEREKEEQSLAPWMAPDQLIRNDSSRRIHVLISDGHITCGRDLPVKYTVLDDIPIAARFCNGCF